MVRSCVESRPCRNCLAHLPELPATDHRIYCIYIYMAVSYAISHSRIDLHVSSSLSRLCVGGNQLAVGEKSIVIKGIFKPNMLQKKIVFFFQICLIKV